MIEKIIIDYLSEELGIGVYAEMPTPKPSNFVLIKRINGGRTNQISAATFSLYVYSTSMYDTVSLMELVKKLILKATVLPEISSVNIGGENVGTDSNNKVYRCELITNIYYYTEE